MSKDYSFQIDEFDLARFDCPIRGQLELLNVALASLQVMMQGRAVERSASSAGPHFRVVVDKMKRIIVVTSSRLYSLSFPFSVQRQKEKYSFSLNGMNVDSLTLSCLTAIFRADALAFGFESLLDVIDETYLDYKDQGLDREVLSLMAMFLISYPYGYIRYDEDREHEDGALHPLHHLDIGCSNAEQFKLGLTGAVDCDDLIDILNVRTECHYLRRGGK